MAHEKYSASLRLCKKNLPIGRPSWELLSAQPSQSMIGIIAVHAVGLLDTEHRSLGDLQPAFCLISNVAKGGGQGLRANMDGVIAR